MNKVTLQALAALLNEHFQAGIPINGTPQEMMLALEAFLDVNPDVNERMLAAGMGQKFASHLPLLHEAKERSDKRDYRGKSGILRHLMSNYPDEWEIDSDDGKGIAGITHKSTGYRFHIPKDRIPPKVTPVRPKAVIIKGNPKYIEGNARAEDFYKAMAAKLEDAGYDVAFDPGEPHTEPPPADLWVGHSRGMDRLRFAPEGVRTVRVDDLQEPYDMPEDTTDWTPPDAHYQLTPKLEEALLGVSKPAAAAPPPITGPEAIAHALSRINLDTLEEEAKQTIRQNRVSKRPAAVQVLNTITGLRRNNITPGDLMVKSVPVIPPVFRPFSVAGNTFVAGDANELYQDLFKHRDIYKQTREVMGDAGASEARLTLYDAVRALYGYADPVSPKVKARGVAGFLRTVSGASPKTGVVQRRLLSKPQDTVARGTIIVDPDLELDEIAVPRDMARTAYANYVQRRLVRLGMTPGAALEHITNKSDYAEKALEAEVKDRPVLYSRAPAWHKFSFLAGRPKLIDGNAIAINPYVTTGLNADFDGDQINIHVPSSSEAVLEAKDKLMPSRMLFSNRDPDATVPVPKQEHILGLYTASHRAPTATHYFPTEEAAVKAIQSGAVPLRDNVEIGPNPNKQNTPLSTPAV